MATFAVINGKVWAEVESVVIDMSAEVVTLFDDPEVSEDRVHALLDVMEEFLDKRDLTIQAFEDRVSQPTEDRVDEAL